MNETLNCPEPGELMAFISDKEGMTIDTQAQIAAHIKACDACSEITSLFQDDRFDNPAEYELEIERIFEDADFAQKDLPESLLAVVRELGGETGVTSTPQPQEEVAKPEKASPPAEGDRTAVIVRYAAAAVLGAVTMLWLFLGSDPTPSEASIAHIDTNQRFWQDIRSGNASSPVEAIVKKARESDSMEGYETAVFDLSDHLESDFRNYHAWLYKGIFLLLAVQKSGELNSKNMNQQLINQGVIALDKALSLNDDNLYYQETALWFKGKALLMKGDISSAKKIFQEITELPEPALPRKKTATKLLETLNRMNP